MKRASPSKGDIAPHIDAPQQALAYALAGACTISTLTEPKWFKGSLDDMAQVRAALEAACLRPIPGPALFAWTGLLVLSLLPRPRLLHPIRSRPTYRRSRYWMVSS